MLPLLYGKFIRTELIEIARNYLKEDSRFDPKRYQKTRVVPVEQNPHSFWVKFLPGVTYVQPGEAFYGAADVLTEDGKVSQVQIGHIANESVAPEPLVYHETENSRTVVAFVSDALRKYGDFGVYGDLSAGLEELSKKYEIVILSRHDHYVVTLVPDSQTGHEFNFKVSMSGEIRDIMVGEMASPI